jgi:ribosomal protein S18 acetylase RimI-like enzyme
VWRDELPNDQVATVHLLAVTPSYQGRSLGIRILEEAMEIAIRNGKKALRLDTLKTNLPAQRMYEKADFSYRGVQRLYAENTGMTDFLYYERIPKCDLITKGD